MGQAILHRGPDQGAEWIDSDAGIGLASRRLAIIDLSAAGDQPMHSPSGRYVVSYNGEIYNHRDLRAELERSKKAPAWRGGSDTETLLAGFEVWGVAATLQRAVGMFAFALWDRADRKLYLGRDRLGEKPMYYGWQGAGRGAVFLFGSELKALACHPAFEADVDRNALAAFMDEGYVPAPQSIYRNIFKLLPGCILTLAETGDPRVEAYWSASDAVQQGLSNPYAGGEDEALDELEALLSRSVTGQLISDVPLGAFLSGGIDSSIIVALMQRASGTPVQTFTIGFEDERFNEAPFASKVAEHLGTDHHELTITGADTLAVVPKLPSIYDEPFADSSQVPTFLVSELARRSVTVALSGDGGDELFAGYGRYGHVSRIWSRARNLPASVRTAGGAVLLSAPPALWNGFAKLANIRRPHSTFADQVARGARLLGAKSPIGMSRGISQRWDGNSVVIGSRRDHHESPSTLSPVESVMAMDLERYLPDDILVKVDRAAMAVSLETRAPYLDHRVVEFAWRLPLDLKLRGRSTKRILRRLLGRHVPEELFERSKRGFSIPVDEWLRGPLKEWAEDLLSPARLQEQGYFRPAPIRQAWDAHLGGQSNRQAQLWTVLMFQAWLEAGRASSAQPVTRRVA